MSNIDTFDMKPEMPIEYRGEFQSIDTNIPGVTVCEHLPLMSQRLDKLCQVRTITHGGGQHAEACHFMLTGYPQVPDVSAQPVGSTGYPMFGLIVGREKGCETDCRRTCSSRRAASNTPAAVTWVRPTTR